MRDLRDEVKEVSLMCNENNVSKNKYRQSTKEPYYFLYIDKPKKKKTNSKTTVMRYYNVLFYNKK